LAKQKGATNEQIEAVSEFETGPFNEGEKMGFRYADRLHRSPSEIDDRFFAEAGKHFSAQQIIELTAVAGAFEFFTRFVDALRIPVTPPATTGKPAPGR
jgi:alkylhydroperoxidase family enzyme